jgi:glycine/D-amino acid oxidase-like deaminating enzyme
MIAAADAVVVGSGAFGASVAYHLARRGARVAMLERRAGAARGVEARRVHRRDRPAGGGGV